MLRFTVARRTRFVGADGGVLSGLAAGLKYVIGHRTLRAMVSITVLMHLLMFPYVSIVPVIARDILHVGAGLMGV